jgi:hypothetical protein
MDTFEYYYRHFEKFKYKITCWKPDYIVPVARKGCKLLKASNEGEENDTSLIKYKNFFVLNNVSVKGKKIAIIDDATQFTSTLQEYRAYFENLGGEVRTFSFIGHENLYEGKKWKYDEKAEIEIFLPDPVYQEYILQQSYFLLKNGNHYDLDHLVFEVELPKKNYEVFMSKLKTLGLLLPLEDYFLKQKTERFSLINPSFFNKLPFFSDESVNLGQILKIKFIYNAETQKLHFSPLVFPVWDYKNKYLKKSDFCNIPFYLPFDIPSTYSSENKDTLLRVYYNLQFAYVGGFAKAFFQQLSSFDLGSSLKIKRDDLNAIMGIEDSAKFIESLAKYICCHERQEFSEKKSFQKLPVAGLNRFHSFGEVLAYLKNNYEKLCRKKKKRVGIHYYLSYEKLFSRFQDKISLTESLDYYCDFGVLVPETIIRDGKIQRYCRTGEPNHEQNWNRTQVLIPLVIEQYKQEFNTDSIEPMLLNKLLSNFTYDYPSDIHHELHCLIGEPYTFGTLVRAYHYQRAQSKPSIYNSRVVSPFYHWDGENKVFSTVNLPEVKKKIRCLFDERQEISYSEIITYFKLLLKIYTRFKKVDTLNMLSICREENYYYSHVLFNIRTWIENYGNFLDNFDFTRRIELLHEAGRHANSSWNKIKLAENLKPTLDIINNEMGADMDFLKALDKILKNYTPFSSKFQETFQILKQIIELELILTTLSLNHYEPAKKYQNQLIKHEAIKILGKHSVIIPDDFTFQSENEFLEITRRVFVGIEEKMIVSLPPEEEPLLSTRLRKQKYEKAKNIAAIYVCDNDLHEATILFMDFSGLRTIPEPKEVTISQYYTVTEKNARKRGHKLYGGKDGDDAFSYIFHDIEQAIQCAKDIKRNFQSDLFLAANGDIKFGICTTKLSDDKDRKESEIIRCWGTAKDCCEYKGPSFRNKGHLLVSQETIMYLTSIGNSQVEKFIKIDGEQLKNENSSSIYRFTEIDPIK